MSVGARERRIVRRRNPGRPVSPAPRSAPNGVPHGVGQSFDPTRHEAMATVRDVNVVPGTVVDEAGRGYLWNDQLLRPARVRVAE